MKLPKAHVRVLGALHWLLVTPGVTRERFHRDQHPGGAMLLEGLVSRGFVALERDTVSIAPAGRAFMNERRK